MDSLVLKQYDKDLQSYEINWIDKIINDGNRCRYYNNPSRSFYTSMVYGFARHLPYSMDIEQPEYVPADFLNMMPFDVEENAWFKYEDRRTYFNAMIHWGDTFKTGMLLQMCALFQKMLLGYFPTNFELTEEDYHGWGIDEMTNNKEYNRCFFETLKSLPDYYKRVIASRDNVERRKVLEAIYAEMMQRISARYGGVKVIGSNGEVVKESKGVIPIRPHADIEMIVHWDNLTYHDGIPEVIEAIKQEQLKRYIGNNSCKLDDSMEKNYIQKK